MDYKTHRKYSTAYLASEFRSYGRNKLEDRKLALHNDGVNKNIERRRKSFVSEKDQINKHFQDNVSKTTPSLETYLRKSQPKYNAWKLREQERLDRRYRGLYRSYLKEYSDLKLDESVYNMAGIRKLSTSSDSGPLPPKGASEIVDNEQIIGPDDVIGIENDANLDQVDGATNLEVCENEEIDEILALGQMLIGGKRSKTQSVTDFNTLPTSDINSRRFSTGGILFQAEKKMHNANIPPQDDTDTNAGDTSESQTNTASTDKSSAPQRRPSKGDNADKLTTVTVPKKKTRRSTSLIKTSGSGLQLPLGTRLDRRSSLAHVNIAVKYGN